ncbi:MAG: aldo/keto reductase [Bdellovibrionota bacterium]
MKLAIGSVQFGVAYGVTNTTGQTSAQEVAKILETAKQNGIDLIDTAAAYGVSEETLGAQPGFVDFKVVTKLAPISAGLGVGAVRDGFSMSLKKLRRTRVEGLLAHRPEDLLESNGERFLAIMRELKSEGLTDKIGVSVYNQEQIDALWSKFKFDLIQLPLNIFDQRLFKSGAVQRLIDSGVEVHVRSVFWQGLLAKRPLNVPAPLKAAEARLSEFHEWSEQASISPRAAALKFVEMTGAHYAVVGAETSAQLSEIADDFQKSRNVSFDRDWSWTGNPDVLNPQNWKG